MAQNTRNVAMQFSLKNNIKRSNIIIIITCSFVIVFTAFNHLYLSMGRYWNVRSVWETIFPLNSSHLYSTQPNYRSTPNYPTKTKARVPLSLFVALRLFLRADSRSRSTYHLFFPKEQNVLDQYNLAKNVLDQFFSHSLANEGNLFLHPHIFL